VDADVGGRGLSRAEADIDPITFRGLLIAVVVAWAAFAVISLLRGGRPRILTLQLCLTAGTVVAGLLVRWRPETARMAAHAVAGSSAVGLVLNSWWAGGPLSISYWFLPAIPLWASMVVSQRAGLGWALASVALVPLAVFPPSGVVIEFIPAAPQRAIGAIALVAVSAALALLARRRVDHQTAQLRAIAREKSELLATICHEIRTPLHGVLGTASLLEGTPLSEDQHALVGSIDRSGASLKRIVDDVLDMAALEARGLSIEPQPVDLLDVVEDVVDLFMGTAAEAGVTLACVVENPELLQLVADGSRVRQVLANLVGNAVKFTREGSVVVRVEATSAEPSVDVRIAVEDTGPGIPAERLDSLFVAFEQASSQLARLHGGSGLGLALARDLTRAMGGTIRVATEYTDGARIELSFRFPRAPTRPDAQPTHPVTLLIEADAVAAEGARSTARALGVDLEVVATVDAAAASLESRPAEALIVIDSETVAADAASARLAPLAGPAARLLLAAGPVRLRDRLDDGAAAAFDGTTVTPLRRSRLASLLRSTTRRRALPSQPPSGEAQRALVVDDDPTSREVLRRLLVARGLSVQTAASGADALRALERAPADVVLSDLHMPQMDGTELAERIRQSGARPRLIAVSATVRPEDRERCRAAGFESFLSKPFDPDELDQVLLGATDVARSSRPPPSAEPPLVDREKLGALEALMGEETAATLDELEENIGRLLEVLGDPATSVADAERSAHTIASSALTAGLARLGERARSLELGIVELETDARVREARELDALSRESFVALRG